MNDDYWIFILNSNPGGLNGGSAAFYMIGHFNGEEFSPIQDDFI